MDVAELEAQLNELEAVALSSKVDVTFDKASSTIRATRTVRTPGRYSGIPIGSSGRHGSEPSTAAPTFPKTESESAEKSKALQTAWPSGGGESADFESDWGTTRVEPVAEISLADVEVPDEFIDERMRLAFDRERAGYLPEVKLVGFGASGVWEVVEDYSYPIDYFAVGRGMTDEARRLYDSSTSEGSERRVPHLTTVTAKKGFQFDRASIPRIFWVIISKDDLSNVPPLFHDLLYRCGGKLPEEWVSPFTEFTRSEADSLFLHLMKRSGVTSWRIHIAYQAVSQFSSFAWGKKAG